MNFQTLFTICGVASVTLGWQPLLAVETKVDPGAAVVIHDLPAAQVRFVCRSKSSSLSTDIEFVGPPPPYEEPPPGSVLKVTVYDGPWSEWNDTFGFEGYYYRYEDRYGPSWSRQQYEYKVVASPTLAGLKATWTEIYRQGGDIPDQTTKHAWTIDAQQSSLYPLASGSATGLYLVNSLAVEFPVELAVDANRDGQIKLASEDATDATTEASPYRFWLNDDIDRSHTVDGNDTEEDDISPAEATSRSWQADWKSNTIVSKRDLEDFSRLWINASGLAAALKPKNNTDQAEADLYLGLQWADASGSPGIKIYPHVESQGGTQYLTDTATADAQIGLDYAMKDFRDTVAPDLSGANVVSGTDFFVIPPRYFNRLSDAQPKTFFLFEGVTAGKGQLKLVILKKENGAYTKIGDGPGVWMDLKSIEDFYERWTVGDTDGGVPWTTASRKKVQLSASGNAIGHSDGFAYDGASPEEQKYILYVHGWNMQPWEKNRFAETMFKRLYWQGYKGRFGIFCWPTTYAFEPPLSAILDGTNYDRGEWTAWRAATPLKNLLVNLHGDYGNQVYVMAHSMGNVVTGEALRLASQQGGGQLVNTYVASQAAVPAHCYDGGRAEDIAAVFGFWTSIGRTFDGSTFPQTPNVYPDWLANNGAAVGRRVNFYNENDYALWHDVWELNQFFKPDHPDGSEQPWHYSYEDDLGAPPNTYSSFIRFDHYDDMANPVGIHDLQLGTGADVQDRYEIMAFASEARTKAVGAATALPNFNPVNLQAIWPTDNQSVKLHDGLDYSAHKWHSAQFRSTNMRQSDYWQTLLGGNGFRLITAP